LIDLRERRDHGAPSTLGAHIVKSTTHVTTRRDHQTSPVAIIGGILALGVVRTLTRAKHSQTLSSNVNLLNNQQELRMPSKPSTQEDHS